MSAIRSSLRREGRLAARVALQSNDLADAETWLRPKSRK
jgi:hypothetical protein